jgi:hypothetical protein
MPDLGFKDRHIPGLLDGSKPFTLRRAWKNGRTPDLGAKLRLVAGWRSPARRVFATAVVGFRARVGFTALGLVDLDEWRAIPATPWADTISTLIASSIVLAPTNTLCPNDERFAQLDGFESYAAFWGFHSNHRPTHAVPVVRRELIGLAYVTQEFAR